MAQTLPPAGANGASSDCTLSALVLTAVPLHAVVQDLYHGNLPSLVADRLAPIRTVHVAVLKIASLDAISTKGDRAI